MPSIVSFVRVSWRSALLTSAGNAGAAAAGGRPSSRREAQVGGQAHRLVRPQVSPVTPNAARSRT